MDRICGIRKGNFIQQAREHEGKPGNAALRSGFMHFAFVGDQSRDCGMDSSGFAL
jgi:hypothetical protein